MKKFKIDSKVLILFAIVFMIALCLMTAGRVAVAKVAETPVFNPSEGTILNNDMPPVTIDKSSPFYEAFSGTDRVNVLLLGVAEKNTDTIMLASYDTVNQKVDLISVPRDTYYARSGYKNYAYNKINSVYRTEGVVGIATAVSELLYGMPIHYYAIVEYSDICKVMDAIGGVYVDVPFRMKYDDPTAEPELHIDIPQGHVKITSENVEQYLRFRHGNPGYQSYYNGDLGRIQTQQAFVKLVIKECLKLKNITSVIKVAMDNIDSDITYEAVVNLAQKAAGGLNADSISSYRLPGKDATLNGLSFWVIDDSQVYSMLEGILIPADSNTSEGAVSGAAVN